MSAPHGNGGSGPGPCSALSGGCLQVTSIALPAACAGVPYVEELSASGGSPPYLWELVSSSTEQFALSSGETSAQARVVSTAPNGPTSPAVLRVRVSDQSEPPQSIELDLDLRLSCWLAYLTDESPALTLVAPHTSTGSGSPLVRSLPSAEQLASGRVTDFAFSPDGTRIAARIRDAGDTHRLALIDVSNGEVIVSASPIGSVTAYAWSPDGSTLAIAATDGTTSVLGGARWPSPGPSSLGALTLLAPTAMVADSEIYWVGGDHVLVHAADENGSRFLAPARLTPTGFEGFSSQIQDFPYQPEGLQIFPAKLGVFVSSPFDFAFDFLAVAEPDWTTTLHTDGIALPLMSPERERTAKVVAGELLIHEADRNLGLPPEAVSPYDDAIALPGTTTCDLPLAWSLPGDLISCATSEKVSFASVDGAGAHFRSELTVLGAPDSVRNQRRAFSPGGRVLALVAEDPQGERHVWFVDVELGTRSPDIPEVHIDTVAEGNIDLIWSPDERWLVTQVGSKMLLQSIHPVGARSEIQLSLTEPGPCNETFNEAEWCGVNAQRAVRWSSDSSVAAVVSADRSLHLIQPGAAPNVHPLTGTCVSPCAFEFQPLQDR